MTRGIEKKQTEKRKSMLKIGSVIKGFDIAKLLQNQNGIFEVESPQTNEKYTVLSEQGHSITSFVPVQEGKNKPQRYLWTCTKIGEVETEKETG